MDGVEARPVTGGLMVPADTAEEVEPRIPRPRFTDGIMRRRLSLKGPRPGTCWGFPGGGTQERGRGGVSVRLYFRPVNFAALLGAADKFTIPWDRGSVGYKDVDGGGFTTHATCLYLFNAA